ncbi:hypothetical protein GWI33_014775 [Rhynchophorus ferrugineus]|uniref:Uncharacterized protein n=1 Tax=Rhynchophorus ferrugineus TaxID=354439 RepID=A0A834IEH6_RHYFE|nr:hypothetical protein GWI33_014775 [Rhynchophorus ferrugineus]
MFPECQVNVHQGTYVTGILLGYIDQLFDSANSRRLTTTSGKPLKVPVKENFQAFRPFHTIFTIRGLQEDNRDQLYHLQDEDAVRQPRYHQHRNNPVQAERQMRSRHPRHLFQLAGQTGAVPTVLLNLCTRPRILKCLYDYMTPFFKTINCPEHPDQHALVRRTIIKSSLLSWCKELNKTWTCLNRDGLIWTELK